MLPFRRFHLRLRKKNGAKDSSSLRARINVECLERRDLPDAYMDLLFSLFPNSFHPRPSPHHAHTTTKPSHVHHVDHAVSKAPSRPSANTSAFNSKALTSFLSHFAGSSLTTIEPIINAVLLGDFTMLPAPNVGAAHRATASAVPTGVHHAVPSHPNGGALRPDSLHSRGAPRT